MPNARPKTTTTKADAMTAGRRRTTRAEGKAAQPELGDHPDTLGIIHRAMNSAAKAAIAENDRLELPTPGTDATGKIAMRQLKKHARTVDAG